VKDKVQARMPIQITRRSHRITHATSGFFALQNLIPFEHCQTALHVIVRNVNGFGNCRERRRRLLFARGVDDCSRNQFFVRGQDERFLSPPPDDDVKFRILFDVLADAKARFIG